MSTMEAAIRHLPPEAARMVAVEILLADPEALDDDVLESCLYVYREKMRVMTAAGADLEARARDLPGRGTAGTTQAPAGGHLLRQER